MSRLLRPWLALRLSLVSVSLGIPACVIGRDTRPSANESAQGPLGPPVTGSPVVPSTTPEQREAPQTQQKPGQVWVRGYWHWDGVRYVWQRGR